MADITVQVSSAGLTAYGSSSWGSFSYGGNQQPSVTVQSGTEAFPNQGWGSDSWGVENWGESGNVVSLTGLQLTSNSGEKETWGQNAWNVSSTEWGGPFITQVAIGQQIVETGEEVNSTVASVSITTATEVFLNENPLDALTISEGTVDPAPDVMPSGVQLSASLGNAVAYNEQGWGRDDWGTEVWGAEGIWSFVDVTGVSSSTSIGDEDVDISVDVELSSQSSPGWGSSIGWGDQSWGQATVDMGMAMSEGTVDPAPDTDITGVQLNTTTNAVSIQANANLTVTGQQLTITLGDENSEAVTIASPTGIELTTTMGVPTAGLSVLVEVTGVTSTTSTGIIGLNAWELVDSGTSPTWTVVDKAA